MRHICIANYGHQATVITWNKRHHGNGGMILMCNLLLDQGRATPNPAWAAHVEAVQLASLAPLLTSTVCRVPPTLIPGCCEQAVQCGCGQAQLLLLSCHLHQPCCHLHLPTQQCRPQVLAQRSRLRGQVLLQAAGGISSKRLQGEQGGKGQRRHMTKNRDVATQLC